MTKKEMIQITTVQSLIDAVKRRAKEYEEASEEVASVYNEDSSIETFRFLNGGGFTRYTWAFNGDDKIELLYMDEIEEFTEKQLSDAWPTIFERGMSADAAVFL